MQKLLTWTIAAACTVGAINGAKAKGNDNDPIKKVASKDSSGTGSGDEKLGEMGFRNLFNSDAFNPMQPYTAQINPKAVPFVKDYIARSGKMLENMKVWGQPYFRLMDGILASYGLPKELKYLAVIESHLKPYALSWAGAVGPWQFMPETGRRMGLVINSRVDERYDYFKSTHAAARYLRELYNQLGDWLLVIAAYNGGPGRVFSAQRRSGSTDFWDLQYYLPEESRNHVKKFIGTHFIMEGSGGLTTSTAGEWKDLQTNIVNQAALLQSQLTEEELALTTTVEIQGKYNSVVIANHLVMDINEFNRLNPHFDKMVATDAGYSIRLPKDKMELFNANRYIILHQSILATLHSASMQTSGYPAANPTSGAKKK